MNYQNNIKGYSVELKKVLQAEKSIVQAYCSLTITSRLRYLSKFSRKFNPEMQQALNKNKQCNVLKEIPIILNILMSHIDQA